MVAAAVSPQVPKNPNLHHSHHHHNHHHREDLLNPNRPPLIPSEKDNAASSTAAAAHRRPRTKDVSSRYLSSTSSTSNSSSTTTTTTTTTTSTASSGSSSSSSSRRFPSPLISTRGTASRSTALPQPKRSQSVDRTRPVTPRVDRASAGGNAGNVEPSAAAKALCTTTRSLSVSFQGESFFYQTSKAKAAAPSPARRGTPERRRTATTPSRGTRPDGGDQAENSRPMPDHLHRWPGVRSTTGLSGNPLTRSMDFTDKKQHPLMASVRLLPHSVVFEEGRRISFDGGDLSASSDTDSVSSGSNSGAPELSLPSRPRALPRGISVPARFWQETNSRLRRLTDTALPLTSPLPGSAAVLSSPKPAAVKKPVPLVSSPMSSPRSTSSPMRGGIRSVSPSKAASSPARAAASPVRMRNGSNLAGPAAATFCQPGLAPSIISFAAEIRRAKKGENRIEEAHLLRLLHNQHLQWRFVNARATTALMAQTLSSEKNIYNTWVATSEMRDSVTSKRVKLQLLTQNMKLTSVLKAQMSYLEEWSHLEREHSTSLSGAIEALKASTLRLPVVGGARAEIMDVREAVCSAVDVMQAMGSSICSLLSKADRANCLVSEVAQLAAREQALLVQARDLLSSVAAMHVKQCSLRGQLVQLKRKASSMQF